MLATGTDDAVQEQHVQARRPRDRSDAGPARPTSRPRSRASWPRGCATSPSRSRLGYVTNVFRYDEPRVSHYREFYQAGVELIGLDKPEAEVEIIAMAIEGLRALGLERFQIDLGPSRLLPRPPRRGEGRRRAPRASCGRRSARKDVSTLERLVGDLAPPAHVARGAAGAADARRPRGGARAGGGLRPQRARRAGAGEPGRRCTACSKIYGLGRRRAARPGRGARLRLLLRNVLRGVRGRLRRLDGRRRPLRRHARPLRLRVPGRRLRLRRRRGRCRSWRRRAWR